MRQVKACIIIVFPLLVLTILSLHSKFLVSHAVSVAGMFTVQSSTVFHEREVENNHAPASNRSKTNPSIPGPRVRRLQEYRKGRVQSLCKQYGLSYNALGTENVVRIDVSRIYVNDKYRLLYCEVPKVACTNWKRILLMLEDKINTSDPEQLSHKLVHTIYQKKYLRTLNTYKAAEILAKIRSYYKFMFVRDPLERIVSAYRNKFVSSYSKEYRLRFGREIVKRYRENASKHSLQYGDDVQFREFVQYLLDRKFNDLFDVHWRPYHQLCHPCLINYDFIGKYETLKEDVDFILERLGLNNRITFPEKPQSDGPKTADILKTTYVNISSEDIRNLWRIYSVDYSLFDYPYPDLRK